MGWSDGKPEIRFLRKRPDDVQQPELRNQFDLVAFESTRRRLDLFFPAHLDFQIIKLRLIREYLRSERMPCFKRQESQHASDAFANQRRWTYRHKLRVGTIAWAHPFE